MKFPYAFPLVMFVLLGSACSDDDDQAPTQPDTEAITFTDPANSGGCVDFQFYHYSDDREYGLLLSGDTADLDLTADWQSFDLAEGNDGRLTLELYEFSQPVDAFFCDDVLEAKENPIQEWRAERGTVRLRIARQSTGAGTYEIDVVMLDVMVGELQLDRLERSNVEVGWIPG